MRRSGAGGRGLTRRMNRSAVQQRAVVAEKELPEFMSKLAIYEGALSCGALLPRHVFERNCPVLHAQLESVWAFN